MDARCTEHQTEDWLWDWEPELELELEVGNWICRGAYHNRIALDREPLSAMCRFTGAF